MSLLQSAPRSRFIRRLNRLSDIIALPEEHESFWNAYCLTRLEFYTRRLAETATALVREDDVAHHAAGLMNMFTCQAHHAVITTALELVRTGHARDSFGIEEELAALNAMPPNDSETPPRTKERQ